MDFNPNDMTGELHTLTIAVAAQLIRDDYARMGKMVRLAGLKPE